MTRVEDPLDGPLHRAVPAASPVKVDDITGTVHRRGSRRSAVAGTVVGVAVALTAASCAGMQGSGQPRAPAGAANLVALTRHVVCPQEQVPVPRPRLAAFHALTAVTCGEGERTFPGGGRWLVSVRSIATGGVPALQARSEEHTSELQSRRDLVCRLLLEKKKKKKFPYLTEKKKKKKKK